MRGKLLLQGAAAAENDIWIAAVAGQHQLVVATRDAHFGEVDGVAVLSW